MPTRMVSPQTLKQYTEQLKNYIELLKDKISEDQYNHLVGSFYSRFNDQLAFINVNGNVSVEELLEWTYDFISYLLPIKEGTTSIVARKNEHTGEDEWVHVRNEPLFSAIENILTLIQKIKFEAISGYPQDLFKDLVSKKPLVLDSILYETVHDLKENLLASLKERDKGKNEYGQDDIRLVTMSFLSENFSYEFFDSLQEIDNSPELQSVDCRWKGSLLATWEFAKELRFQKIIENFVLRIDSDQSLASKSKELKEAYRKFEYNFNEWKRQIKVIDVSKSIDIKAFLGFSVVLRESIFELETILDSIYTNSVEFNQEYEVYKKAANDIKDFIYESKLSKIPQYPEKTFVNSLSEIVNKGKVSPAFYEILNDFIKRLSINENIKSGEDYIAPLLTESLINQGILNNLSNDQIDKLFKLVDKNLSSENIVNDLVISGPLQTFLSALTPIKDNKAIFRAFFKKDNKGLVAEARSLAKEEATNFDIFIKSNANLLEEIQSLLNEENFELAKLKITQNSYLNSRIDMPDSNDVKKMHELHRSFNAFQSYGKELKTLSGKLAKEQTPDKEKYLLAEFYSHPTTKIIRKNKNNNNNYKSNIHNVQDADSNNVQDTGSTKAAAVGVGSSLAISGGCAALGVLTLPILPLSITLFAVSGLFLLISGYFGYTYWEEKNKAERVSIAEPKREAQAHAVEQKKQASILEEYVKDLVTYLEAGVDNKNDNGKVFFNYEFLESKLMQIESTPKLSGSTYSFPIYKIQGKMVEISKQELEEWLMKFKSEIEQKINIKFEAASSSSSFSQQAASLLAETDPLLGKGNDVTQLDRAVNRAATNTTDMLIMQKTDSCPSKPLSRIEEKRELIEDKMKSSLIPTSAPGKVSKFFRNSNEKQQQGVENLSLTLK